MCMETYADTMHHTDTVHSRHQNDKGHPHASSILKSLGKHGNQIQVQ
jgi:hypothetical protein